MQEEFKVEIYVHEKGDIQKIVSAVEKAFEGHKTLSALPGEFGMVRVEHHHYQLD